MKVSEYLVRNAKVREEVEKKKTKFGNQRSTVPLIKVKGLFVSPWSVVDKVSWFWKNRLAYFSDDLGIAAGLPRKNTKPHTGHKCGGDLMEKQADIYRTNVIKIGGGRNSNSQEYRERSQQSQKGGFGMECTFHLARLI